MDMRLLTEASSVPVVCPCCGAEVRGVVRHVRGRPWDGAQDAFISRASSRGASSKLIAYVFGTSPSIVHQRLMELRKRG